MARKPSNRQRENQRARQEYVGKEAPKSTGGRKPYHSPYTGWRKRVDYIMQDMRLSFKHQAEVLSVLDEMEKNHGAASIEGLTTTQLNTVIRKIVWELTVATPRISGIYNSAATLTQRASIAPEGDFTPKGGHGTSDRMRMRLSHTPTQDLPMDKLRTHEHPDVKTLYNAIRQDKGHKDSAVVLSADNKPFYIFGHISKFVHKAKTEEKGFNVFIPRAMDYRGHKKALPSMKEMLGFNFWTKWRTLFRTQDMAKLTDKNNKPIVLTKDLDHAIEDMQNFAWRQAKSFYSLLEAHKQTTARIQEIEQKYLHHSGVYTVFSKEDELEHRKLKEKRTAIEQIFKGQTPRSGSGAKEAEVAFLTKTAGYVGDSFTWYLWLLACEHQFGILVPERKKAPENSDKSKGRNPVQPKLDQSVIQPIGREEVPRWSLDALKGIGFRASEFDRFEDELKKSNYHFTAQGNKAETHLWIPLVDTVKLERMGFKLLPGDISKYLSEATEQIKTDYLIGRENGEISVRHDLPIHQWNFMVKGKRYALIPAVEYLKYFDSPKHGGARFIHGEPFFEPAPRPMGHRGAESTSSKMQSRVYSYERKRFIKTGAAPKFAHDPVGRREELLKIGQNVADRIEKRGIKAKQAKTIIQQRIAQRKGFSYEAPGATLPGRRIVHPNKTLPPVTHRTFVGKYQRPFLKPTGSTLSAQTRHRAALYRSRKGTYEVPMQRPVMRQQQPIKFNFMRNRVKVKKRTNK